GPGLRLLLLLLARLPLLQLLRGEEDLVLLSVRTGQHPVRLPLGGEEHRGAAASPAPAAATASRPRLAGCWGGSARRGAGAGRALVLLGAILLRAVVSVGVGCLRSGRGGEGVQGVVVVAHVGPCESDASAGKRANTRSAPPMNIRSRSSAGQPGKWARPRRKSPPYSSSRSRVQEPSIGPFAAPPPGGGSGMHARWGFAPPGPRRRAWRFPAPCGGSGRSPDSGRGRARARGGARPRPPRCSRASRAGGTAVPTRRGPRAAPAGARRPRPSDPVAARAPRSVSWRSRPGRRTAARRRAPSAGRARREPDRGRRRSPSRGRTGRRGPAPPGAARPSPRTVPRPPSSPPPPPRPRGGPARAPRDGARRRSPPTPVRGAPPGPAPPDRRRPAPATRSPSRGAPGDAPSPRRAPTTRARRAGGAAVPGEGPRTPAGRRPRPSARGRDGAGRAPAR